MDTASSDKTESIVKEFDCRIYHNEFKDFASQRNYGIDKCSGDYILTLDGDEVLEQISIPTGDDFYIAKVINKIQGQDRSHKSVRLFKNDPLIRYEGTVHETVEHSLKRMLAKRGEMDIVIRHSGYEGMTPEQIEAKIRGLLKIHTEQLKNEPDNPSIYYNMARCYWGLKEYQNAIDYGVLSLFKPIITEAKAEVCLLIYFCYKELNRLEIGINYLLMSGDLIPSCSASANLVNFYKNIGDKDGMIKELQKLKQITINGSNLPNDIIITTESVEQKLTEAINAV